MEILSDEPQNETLLWIQGTYGKPMDKLDILAACLYWSIAFVVLPVTLPVTCWRLIPIDYPTVQHACLLLLIFIKAAMFGRCSFACRWKIDRSSSVRRRFIRPSCRCLSYSTIQRRSDYISKIYWTLQSPLENGT